jgi:hypothetical protein
MDGYGLLLGIIGLASITSWIGIWSAKDEYIEAAKLEVLCIAVAWIAALLIAAYLLVV